MNVPKPTGNLWNKDGKTNHVTMPMPIPVIFTEFKGDITLTDSKLWLMLLHLSWDQLASHSKIGKWHEIQETDLVRLYEKYTGTKDLERLWDSSLRLADIRARYERIDNQRQHWTGATAMFQCEYRAKGERNGIYRYMFPAPLVDILLDPKVYARLRLAFILRLKSKYSVSLYQILETAINLRNPILKATIEDLRKWLKVPDGKLTRWNNLYGKALKPALEEINSNPSLSGMFTEHEIFRCGKGGKVRGVLFTIRKTEERSEFEKSLKSKTKEIVEKIESSEKPISNFHEEIAIKGALYFYKVRYRQNPHKEDLSELDIKEMQLLAEELKSEEKLKKFIDIVCAFRNAPNFISGLKLHKARVFPKLREQDKKKVSQTKIQKKENEEKEEETQIREKFMEYYVLLDEAKMKSILDRIELNSFEKSVIHKDTNAGRSVRMEKVFNFWKEEYMK